MMRILLLLIALGFAADALMFSGAYTQHAYMEISTALGDAVEDVDVDVDVTTDETEPDSVPETTVE